MSAVGYLIAFVLGGTLGVLFACILVAVGKSEQAMETERLEKELATLRRALENRV